MATLNTSLFLFCLGFFLLFTFHLTLLIDILMAGTQTCLGEQIVTPGLITSFVMSLQKCPFRWQFGNLREDNRRLIPDNLWNVSIEMGHMGNTGQTSQQINPDYTLLLNGTRTKAFQWWQFAVSLMMATRTSNDSGTQWYLLRRKSILLISRRGSPFYFLLLLYLNFISHIFFKKIFIFSIS